MAESRLEFTIFYAWQNDRPVNHCRKLIYDALTQACELLGDEDDFPYVLTVTSDTKGVPGLCDIPAVILAKLESADAVVLDLTYIAKTDRKKPKHCPNPNVLFELGYAFRAVGPERLICVMNDAYGPPTEILFDIAHRRHPVRYTSPVGGKTRRQVVSALAEALADALKPTVSLGPRSLGVDDEREFEREISAIRSHWRATTEDPTWPVVFFVLRPAHYRERRWRNADELWGILRKHEVTIAMHEVPPSHTGTDVMPWGLYNGAYGSPAWALTYSGQFWAAIDIGAHGTYKRSEREITLDRTDSSGVEEIGAGEWIDHVHARGEIFEIFRFASSLVGAYHVGEHVSWSATAENLTGTRLASRDFNRLLLDCSRKCASPGAKRSGTDTAADFSSNWAEHLIDFLHEMFSMFDLHGNRMPRQSLERWLSGLKL